MERYFPDRQYETLCALCDYLIPACSECEGALDVGVPAFIDRMTKDNVEYQCTLGGALLWLDCFCVEHYSLAFLGLTPSQQTDVLDLLAYRSEATTNPLLSVGTRFFSLLRRVTVDGFATSKAALSYFGYVGNTRCVSFLGCPEVTDAML